MKRAIQIAAAVLAVATVGLWFAKGANPGWTKNQEQVKTIDPITEIEQVEWRKTFIPGLEVLGGGLVASGALAGISLFLSRKTKNKNQDPIT